MYNSDVWFDQLYREHSARLIKLAFYSLKDRQLAEDVVEETFLTLLYKRRELMSHPNTSGWLAVTLKNIIDDELKSARRKHEAPFVFGENAGEYDTYNQPLKDLLPKGLLAKERNITVIC